MSEEGIEAQFTAINAWPARCEPLCIATAHVGIGPTGRGGFGLAVALDLHAPNLSRGDAEDLMRRVHALCPYRWAHI